MKSNVIVVGIDAIADALKAVKEGRLDATVFQDAKGQGATAVEIAVKIINKQPFEKETYIPFRLVTKENVDEYLRK
jgi:inositol transport system substrate-binding protein